MDSEKNISKHIAESFIKELQYIDRLDFDILLSNGQNIERYRIFLNEVDIEIAHIIFNEKAEDDIKMQRSIEILSIYTANSIKYFNVLKIIAYIGVPVISFFILFVFFI